MMKLTGSIHSDELIQVRTQFAHHRHAGEGRNACADPRADAQHLAHQPPPECEQAGQGYEAEHRDIDPRHATVRAIALALWSAGGDTPRQ